MKKILLIILSLALLLPLSAQSTKKTSVSSKKTTTAKTSTQKKSTVTQKKTATVQKKSTTTQKKATATKKTTTTQKKAAPKTKAQLKKEQEATQKARKQSQARLAQLNKNVKASLDSVLVLDNQIGRQQQSIDSLNKEIRTLGARIDTLNAQLKKLQKDLEAKKQRYAKAMVYMRKNRSVQNKLMFVFSADNFTQMIRRLRYMQEYSKFQKAQGELLKAKQLEVKEKQNELLAAKARKEQNLHAVEQQKKALQGMKENCQTQVAFLNKNISTVRKQIQDYQKKEQALNAEIDRIIKEEIEAARRAEEERKRKAEAEAREKAKKLAEAKAAAERARKAAEAAEAARKNAKTDAEKQKAKAEAEKTKALLKAAEEDVKVATKEEKEERRKAEVWKEDSSANEKLSGTFTKNKGRLPMPITGSYNVIGHYGKYTVAGLKNVTLNNRGIDIRGQQGCSARSIFDGQVSSVFQYAGFYTVMLRHGSYISVYSGLSSVSVTKGQKVSTREPLGKVGKNADGKYVLHFQLRNGSTGLNPELWVK